MCHWGSFLRYMYVYAQQVDHICTTYYTQLSKIELRGKMRNFSLQKSESAELAETQTAGIKKIILHSKHPLQKSHDYRGSSIYLLIHFYFTWYKLKRKGLCSAVVWLG